MNQNERLSAELATQKNSVTQRSNKTGTTTTNVRNGRRESLAKRNEQDNSWELKKELRMSKERELSYEAALVDKDQREAELERIVKDSKHRERAR